MTAAVELVVDTVEKATWDEVEAALEAALPETEELAAEADAASATIDVRVVVSFMVSTQAFNRPAVVCLGMETGEVGRATQDVEAKSPGATEQQRMN